MSFRIQKSLGNSLFQFSVGRRREFPSIDPDPELSTGASGEFIRHRPEIFYSADLRTIHVPEIPKPRSITSAPFWSSLIDGTTRGWVMLALIVFGALLVLMGLAVLANGSPAGWVEVILGLILVAIPFVITTQKRRTIRLHEDRIRREREERDQKNAELLASYTSSLERLREDPTDEALASVTRESEKLDLPYAVWADTAIGTVLYVGFSTLARIGPERAAEVAALMDRSSDAAGLIGEDARAVKHALYSTILWQLLADDRLGETQLKIVRAVQQGFDIKAEDVPIDTAAEAQFHRMRGVDHRNAPRCETEVPLAMNEYCIYSTEVRPASGGPTTITVTNKRMLLGSEKRIEVQVPKIDDVVVDADTARVTVRAAELKHPLDFTADESIYLAAILDLATRLDDRPKGFT